MEKASSSKLKQRELPSTSVDANQTSLLSKQNAAALQNTDWNGSEMAADSQGFDEKEYLAAYSDVREAIGTGRYRSGLEHWTACGRKEILYGHRPDYRDQYVINPARGQKDVFKDPAVVGDFDDIGYHFIYPDVRSTGARQHWLDHGRHEGRLSPGIRPYINRSRSFEALHAKPFGVNFYGPSKAASGLGTAARSYLDALDAAKIPTKSVPLDLDLYRGGLNMNRPAILPAGHKTYRVNLLHQNCDMIRNMCRIYGHNILDDAYNIGMWVWELPTMRQDWMGEYGALDEIWVPTTFCEQAVSTISPIPVRTVPYVVTVAEPSRSMGRAHFGLPEDAYIFLSVFDVSSLMDRKNPHALIRAFKQAFGDDPKVHLVLKYHSASGQRERLVELFRLARGSNIRLISEMYTDEESTALKQVSDCLVSPHRSEGFGLNLAEMMYLGKPAIGTGYSGNVDFMTDENSYLIDHKLVSIERDIGPYLTGAVWADPDVDHLAHLLRHVYENRGEAARKAEKAAGDIRTLYSAEAVGAKMEARLQELGLAEVPLYARNWGRSAAASWKTPMAGVGNEALKSRLQALPHRPVFSVIVPVYNVPGEYLRQCIDSVLAQHYPFWELCLCDDASTSAETVAVLDSYRGRDPRIKIRRLTKNQGISGASNAAVEISTGSFLALLDNDDELHPMALLRFAETLNSQPDLDFIYTDEDKINFDGKHVDDYCKPDWSPEHLESVMYVLHCMAIRKSLFLRIGGFREEFTGAQDFDLALRLSRETSRIHHIPEILYHWRMIPGSAAAVVDAKPKALENARMALEDHALAKFGNRASVDPGLLPGTFRLRPGLSGTPPVTIVIPTDNRQVELPNRPKFTMVDNLILSILKKTTYKNYRILVVDNGNLSQQQRHAYRANGVSVASYTGPTKPFSFAQKANFCFRNVKTDLMVMLNDDMEVITEGWLEALLEFAQNPEIGVVGGKLLYPDNRIQHVGVALGVNDSVAHIYHGFPGDFIGYNGYTHLIRNYAAVTGACMATRMSLINELGGFDESLAIDFNDIDFCLRAFSQGYRNVYTPYCQFFHFEGQSAQRKAQDPNEVALFKARWAGYLDHDPSFNPNFARDRIDYGLKADLNALLTAQDMFRSGE